MNRRTFIAVLGGAISGGLPPARSQEPGRTYRLGGLLPFPVDAPQHLAFLDSLRQVGFIAGQNLTIDTRGYGAPAEQYSQLARELAAKRADAILAGGDEAIRAAQQATTAIPILAVTEDMVGSGLVSSMAHPGANTTGVSLLATELDGKRQEILTEIVPQARHIAVLTDIGAEDSSHLKTLREVGLARGVEVSIHRVRETLKKAENALPRRSKSLISYGPESAAPNFSEFP